MTSDLYPTPTRLDLLRQVDAGRVVLAGQPDTGIRRKTAATLVDDGGSFVRRVASAVAELELAGWIERPNRMARWRLTTAGRARLFAAEHPDKHLSGPCAAGDCDDCGGPDCEHDCSHEGRRRFFEQMRLTGGAL